MLSYVAAHTGQPTEAVALGHAAESLARNASVGTRARVAGRLATAHAAAGDLYAFRRAADQARTLLGKRCPDDDPPALYYLSDHQLSAETGQALVDLATSLPGQARPLLREAVELLVPLTSSGPRGDFQRSALLHGCYLASAHVQQGDLEATGHAVSAAVDRLPAVQSGRCRLLLQDLKTTLRRRRRNPWASDAADRLDAALPTT